MTRFARIALAACMVFAIGASVAWATGLVRQGFVQSSGSIVSCVNNGTGAVRFVDPTNRNRRLSSCQANETKVLVAASQAPASVTADCSHGQTITQALAQTANAPTVLITVKGICNESVTITRDNVTLKGSDGAAINGGVSLDDARNVSIQTLTLTNSTFDAADASVATLTNVSVTSCSKGVNVQDGSSIQIEGGSITCSLFGVHAANDGSVALDNVTVSDATNGFGVGADGGGTVSINDSTISNNKSGVSASLEGSIDMHGTTVVTGSSQGGVEAGNGGSVLVADGADIEGNNGGGAAVSTGGRLVIDGGIVENNTGNGVWVFAGSTVHAPNAIIRNNSGDGIHLMDTSVAFVEGNSQITGNGGWGIYCAGPPSVASTFGSLGTITGNTAGQNNCPTDSYS